MPGPSDSEKPAAPDAPRGGPIAARALRLCLPREHGSWSLALEPLALGLIAAPSAPGAALALAGLVGLFLRLPLRLVRGSDPRRRLAAGCLAALCGVGLAALAAAAWPSPERLWPLLVAAPAGLAFVLFDARRAGRGTAAELPGASAFACMPAAVASIAGWTPIAALALTAAMAGRSLPTVLTLRTYLRRTKGEAASPAAALAAGAAAIAANAILAEARIAPWFSVVVASLLFGRAVWLLGPWRPRLTASKLGAIETAAGGILIAALALLWHVHA